MRRLLLAVLCLVICPLLLLAQTRQINGTVVDASNNQGVISATVKVKGTNISTATDADGRFSLNVPTGPIVLEVSSIGFGTVAYNVGATDNNISVSLSQAGKQMDEVVVTALGIRKEKKALGYAISEVKGDELTQARTNSVAMGLVGKVPGLNVAATATGAGGSTRVVLRGNTSISDNNQPLYVVDGIPIDNSNRGNAGEWGGRDAGDGIQMLNPDEIESMSVLKGGNAAALYGARASAGVILITTKKGSKRKGLGMEFNSNFQVESVMNLTDYQYEYGHGINGQAPTQAQANNIPLNSWGGRLDGSQVYQWDGVQRPYVAQKNNIKNFYDNGTNWNNTISMYGGSDRMTYNFSISDLNNKSVIPNSTLRRNNFAANIGMTPIDNLTVNLSARYIRERTKNRPRLSDSPGNANFTIGIMPTSWDEATFKESKYDPITGGEAKFNSNPFVTNPYWAVEDFQQNDSRDRLIGAVEARYDINKWLYVRGRIGTDQYTRYNFEVTPTGTQYSPGGQINDQSTTRFREFNGEWLVGGRHDIGSKFGIDAFVGGNAMKQIDEVQGYNGNNFFAPGFYNINNLEQKNTYYGYREKRINSLFGSAEFSYNKYLFLTLTGRNDWYSTLPVDNASLFYPSVSASFILSDALKLPTLFDYAKVRASWAQVGGDRNPYGLTLPYSVASATYGGLPVGNIATNTIPNQNLRPYLVTSYEFGVEARMLKNRLGIDLTFYDKRTTDDIINSRISQTSGFGDVLINVGEVSNKGVELLLTGTPIQSKKLTWDVSFNLGYNKSVVEKISDQLTSARIANARSLTAFIEHRTGMPFGQVVAIDYKRDAQGNILLKDGFPQRGEQKTYGTGVAPYTWGFNNAFRFGNFNFEFLIDGRWGGYMYSGTNDFATFRGLHKQTVDGRDEGIVADGVDEVTGAKNTVRVAVQDYWQRVGLNISSPFVYKSDFIKLRQIIFGYRFPENLTKKTPFKGASISLVGRNLLIISKDTPNIDPESTYNSTNGQGLEWYGAPPVRSFGVNLNLKF
ncbi:SusC/RagA family TonB-linked outer membrane protein [Flavihumibacter rivuli]|uniref:SusC/RagA family TonB-linked outer membrane protein n=1 Tax=Flavihumibacter rivuli TaxID=2838156 RepID=UPI001BDDD8FE|nr:SusC/RagA family TonB-linked outer membrane protein [Flavihumibacter rivuli]ULQ56969.1 SusC/RagA family TonB-linked outer membrane protein [Flavihumibacter rivuli]